MNKGNFLYFDILKDNVDLKSEIRIQNSTAIEAAMNYYGALNQRALTVLSVFQAPTRTTGFDGVG